MTFEFCLAHNKYSGCSQQCSLHLFCDSQNLPLIGFTYPSTTTPTAVSNTQIIQFKSQNLPLIRFTHAISMQHSRQRKCIELLSSYHTLPSPSSPPSTRQTRPHPWPATWLRATREERDDTWKETIWFDSYAALERVINGTRHLRDMRGGHCTNSPSALAAGKRYYILDSDQLVNQRGQFSQTVNAMPMHESTFHFGLQKNIFRVLFSAILISLIF